MGVKHAVSRQLAPRIAELAPGLTSTFVRESLSRAIRGVGPLPPASAAAGSVTLPDEAIHLAAAVQAAGYRHVVATLWQIADDTAPSLTETVYLQLAPDGRLDGRRAASALHAAVGELRSRFPDQPSRWASYAHFGP